MRRINALLAVVAMLRAVYPEAHAQNAPLVRFADMVENYCKVEGPKFGETVHRFDSVTSAGSTRTLRMFVRVQESGRNMSGWMLFTIYEMTSKEIAHGIRMEKYEKGKKRSEQEIARAIGEQACVSWLETALQ